MTSSAGDVIEGRYRLSQPLGKGGMAEVWAAVALDTGDEVAVKILREGAGIDSELGRRMRREADLVSAIKSPRICSLLGSGVWKSRLYLVFERLRGEPLADLLDREGTLPFAEVAEIVSGILDGLSDAHRAGVIHRDLTPWNIFLEGWDSDRKIRLIDFGISKAAQGESTITNQGGTLGSYGYMAPEQAQAAHEVDERADIYAVGVIAFQCLAGRVPFESGDPYAALSLKAQVDPPTLGEVTAETWPADLERFLRAALARNRGDRFPSAFAALTAWRAVVAKNQQARTRRHAATAQPREDTHTETMTAAPRGAGAGRRPRGGSR